MTPGYRYYAVTSLAWPTEEDPFAMLRVWENEWGSTVAESYTVRLRWEPSDRLARIERGRDDHDLVPTTLENVERYMARQAESVRETAERDRQG